MAEPLQAALPREMYVDEAAWRTERWRNAAGVFRLEPNLRWGNSPIASDIQGFYALGDTSTRQWQGGYSVELTDGVGNGSATGAPANATSTPSTCTVSPATNSPDKIFCASEFSSCCWIARFNGLAP